MGWHLVLEEFAKELYENYRMEEDLDSYLHCLIRKKVHFTYSKQTPEANSRYSKQKSSQEIELGWAQGDLTKDGNSLDLTKDGNSLLAADGWGNNISRMQNHYELLVRAFMILIDNGDHSERECARVNEELVKLCQNFYVNFRDQYDIEDLENYVQNMIYGEVLDGTVEMRLLDYAKDKSKNLNRFSL